MRYPRESSTRETKDWGGVWHFKVDWHDEGEREGWSARSLEDPIVMPVPANYNVVTRNPRLRDHVGAVGCERTVVGPTSCSGWRSVVRVGGATHNATTWCHDRRVAQHRGGFVPFEGDATPHGRCG